jgi:putative SOS response-associated peptidase YedK
MVANDRNRLGGSNVIAGNPILLLRGVSKYSSTNCFLRDNLYRPHMGRLWAMMINARSETVNRKAVREALKFRRCLIPADGFYEWQRREKNKQPFCFEVNEGELFAFAGLWDRWKDASGTWVDTCAILTTKPNAVTSLVHDRLPVILSIQIAMTCG